jgi:ATP-dependent Clp protease ATP-binding subunit ClpA
MDHGSLTDHNGKKIDFRNVILIMTTNAGAAEMAKLAIGFGSSKREGDDEEAINRLFTPEFRNRLDAIIGFNALPLEVVYRVVEKFVLQLEAQLADRGVTFELDEAATNWLAEEGYDDRMGARPLARLIQRVIKTPLADEVLFGKLKKGGVVKVSTQTSKEGKVELKLDAIPDENARPKSKPKSAAEKKPAAKKPAARKAKKPGKKPPKGGGGSVPRVPLKVE